MKRQYVVIDDDEIPLLTHGADARVKKSVVGQLHVQARCRRRFQPNAVWADAGPFGFQCQFSVQERGVDGVYVPLNCLKPVTLLPHLCHDTAILRYLGPLKFGRRRHEFFGP